MSDFKINMILSTDGKQSVVMEANNKKERDEGIPYAKKLYEKILAEYGTKQEQYAKIVGNGVSPTPKKTLSESVDESKRLDWCYIHGAQMIGRPNKFKPGKLFYSHQVGEGEWCKGVPV